MVQSRPGTLTRDQPLTLHLLVPIKIMLDVLLTGMSCFCLEPYNVHFCSREQNWIASGSFDRTIKIWDLSRSATSASTADPVITLNPADVAAPKSSVYAIATDPYGSTIATGSPERVVRMWDPRSGKRTTKLVGHTDNIRAILISDDAKYVGI